jgi:hypothetical protein
MRADVLAQPPLTQSRLRRSAVIRAKNVGKRKGIKSLVKKAVAADWRGEVGRLK